MRVIGVQHDRANLRPVIRSLHTQSFMGKTVAIENTLPIEQLLACNPRRLDAYTWFFHHLAKYLISHGARVICVDNNRLAQRANAYDEKLDWAKIARIHFRRTFHMVRQAARENADYLIAGGVHAREAQKILGKKADVHILVPRSTHKSLEFRSSAWMMKKLLKSRPKTKEKLHNTLRAIARKPKKK